MDDYNLNFGGDDTADGDEDGEGWQWGGRNATVFLVDAAPQMFRVPASDQEKGSQLPIVTALKCVHASICRQVISSDQDVAAVVLFNTTNTSTKGGGGAAVEAFPHVAVLLTLDRPSADRVMALEALIEGEAKSIGEDYGGVCEDASISDALWACSNLIAQCKSKLSIQSVVLFTCRDQPTASHHLVQQALCKARDLDDAGIDLELISIGADFDAGKFYKNILTLGGDAPDRAPPPSCSSRLEELQDRVRRIEHKQRATRKLQFTLAPGLQMSVGLYTGIRKTSKPSKQKLHSAGNEEVRLVTKEYMEETGELLLASEFVKYQTYGGKRLKFTVEETREMNKVYSSGIELLGFKPRSSIKAFHHVKSANFLYPDEDNIKGSHAPFAALLSRCMARSVVPIVRVVATANAAPAWAALLPQEEQLDDDGCQIKPPGFHVCYLPFADDFRQFEVVGQTRAVTSQVDRAKALVKKLHFRYSPSSFENPELQTHWRNVEALALNRSHLEAVTDYTVPDYARIRRKTTTLVDDLKASVWPQGYDSTTVKRPAPAARAAAKPSAKGTSSVEQMAKDQTVDKLTMTVLKQWLEERGVKVTGKKKPQLVQDVYDACDA